jgi:hypothetical protein
MSRTKKRLAVIGSGTAVAAVVIGGVAFAAFNQSAQANVQGAGTETFAPLTVSGLWKGRPANDGTYPSDAKLLLPGDSGDVALTLTNPATNTVQGEVVSITPNALSDDCSGNIQLATYTPGNALVLDHSGTGSTVILKKAVTLKDAADNNCQNKRFAPTYKVQFQATRDAVKNPVALNPSTPTGGTPTSSAPTGSTPTGSHPTGGTPTGGAPTGGAPTGSHPTGGTPTGGTPTGSHPTSAAPTGSHPAGSHTHP